MRIGSRSGFFGMFLLAFTPPLCNSLISSFRHKLPVNACSNGIITFPALSLVSPPSADLTLAASRCDQSRSFLRLEPRGVRSKLSSIPRLHYCRRHRYCRTWVRRGLGGTKICICRVGRCQEHQDAEELPSLVRNFPGLAIQWPYSL